LNVWPGTTIVQDSRLRRAAATSVSSLVARAANFVSLLILVPLTVPYLGTERYGIWMTLVSLAAFLGVANLGVGSALVALVARGNALAGDDEVSRYVSTAVALFGGIAIFLGVVGAGVIPFLPWDRIFNAPSAAIADEGGHAAIAVFVVFLVSMPIGLISQIRLGYQEGYIAAWFDAAASVLALLGVAVAVALNLGLPAVVLASAAAPLVTGAVNWGLLIRKRSSLAPAIRRVDRRYARALMQSGGLFFALELATIIGFSSDNFVAAQVLGPAAVTLYAVPSRIALAGVAVLSAFSMPLWPAYADALARGDISWALRILRRSLIVTTTAAVIGAAVLVFAGGTVVDAWSRGKVHPHTSLLIGLALWIILGSVGSALSMFLNAAHVVRMQVACATTMALANILLSIWLARRIGISGLIWGTVISYSAFVVMPYVILVPRLVQRMQSRERDEVASGNR
jgi:O-antigen/teichoic acid export membrane protein